MAGVIKDLKMIDFLGMVLPGLAVAILFCFEFRVWSFFANCFGEDIGLLSKFVFIAIFSYVIGMFLHEIGDITEKMLWFNPLLNPRTYAALSTGYIAAYINTNKDLLQINSNLTPLKSLFRNILVWVAVTISVIPTAFFIYSAFQNMYGLAIMFVFVLMPTIIYSFFFLSVIKLLCNRLGFVSKKTRFSNTVLAEAVKSICRNDATIMFQAQIAYGKKTNENQRDISRKRNLFDGFRTMARNSFIAITFIRIYAIISDNKICELFKNPVYNVIACIFLSVLLLRYWHYSFLRYKYLYEDIIFDIRINDICDL